jgi:membrane protease YdiL (CAAX protease family)
MRMPVRSQKPIGARRPRERAAGAGVVRKPGSDYISELAAQDDLHRSNMDSRFSSLRLRAFLRALYPLALKQALAMTIVFSIALGLGALWSINESTTTIELRECGSAVTTDALEREGHALGLPDGWLRESTQDGDVVRVSYRARREAERMRPYPDEVAALAGCVWDGRVVIEAMPLDESAAWGLLFATPVGLLALALAHRETRRLKGRAGTSGRPKVLALAAGMVAGVIALQFGVGALSPEFVEPIRERQSGLLSTPAVVLLALLLLAPIAEELWFRATALRVLSEAGFAKAGAVVTGASFALMHGVVGGWTLTLYYWSVIFALGLVLAWVWLRTRRWTDCLAIHYLNNAPALVVVLSGGSCG